MGSKAENIVIEVHAEEGAIRVIHCGNCRVDLAQLSGGSLDRILASKAVERHVTTYVGQPKKHDIMTIHVRSGTATTGIVLSGDTTN